MTPEQNYQQGYGFSDGSGTVTPTVLFKT